MLTLAVDIGGGTIKLLSVSPSGAPASEPISEATPQPARPEAVCHLIRDMAATLPPFHRVSVGFPGIVKQSVTYNAPNLGNELWRLVPLGDLLSREVGHPVRVVNDVDLQGLGVVRGEGVELVLTLGTGMGAALFTEGVLVPNLELGHHPFLDGQSYEDLVRDSELKRVGPVEWTGRVMGALAQLEPIFNYDLLHLGGGNAQNIRAKLPDNVRLFTLEEALRGAPQVWDA